MARHDVVVFDCDGVLIDSESIACAVDAEHLTRAGYPITAGELARRFAGVPSGAMYAQIEAELGRALPPDLHHAVSERIAALYRTELRAIPGVAGMLDALGLPRCVASSSMPSKLALGLVETGLFDRLYPHIYSAALVERGKPHPDLFLYAALQMQTDPSRCVVVEDSVAGVTAGVAAGMTVIGFTGGSHCPEGHDRALLAAGAAHVIPDICQLPSYIH